MAAKKRTKSAIDVLLIVFSFVPFLNTFTLLHLGGKARLKKWTRSGWIILAVNILLLLTFILSTALQYTEIAEVPYDTKPSEYDFIDRQTYANLSSEEWHKRPEYYAYQEAVDKWYASEAYTQPHDANRRFHSLMEGVGVGAAIAGGIANMILFFYVISQKQLYFDTMRKAPADRAAAYERLRAVDIPDTPPAAPGRPDPAPLPVPPLPAETAQTDVNTADRETLSALPGLTAVDAMKAVQHREANGPFSSVDEFFAVIGARPHVIAKLAPTLTASLPAAAADGGDNRPARSIDI